MDDHLIGVRQGLGPKYGADTADPGAVGPLKTGAEGIGKPRKRKVPKNIKGLKKKKKIRKG